MLDITKEQMRRLEMAEMHFLQATAGYRITNHKCNEDITELGITDINAIIKIITRNG
jgi:hypothetical protein